MSIEAELADAGYELLQEGRDGTRRYARRSTPYLQWWVTVYPDGTGELTWELELGSYLKSKGFHVSAQDELSLLLFPSGETRGRADAQWLTGETARFELMLASVDLLNGT
jgi:hypothetical protein